MDRKIPISDVTISRNATQHIAGTGLRSPCHIQVQTRNGEVTLSGVVQYDHQRNAAVQAVRNIEGVKRIVEKLKVMPPPKREYTPPAKKPAAAAPPAAAAAPDAADAAAEPAPTASSDVDSEPPSSVAPANRQEPLPDPITASTTDVLSTTAESLEFSFCIDVLPHTALTAPPLVVQSAPPARPAPVHPAAAVIPAEVEEVEASQIARASPDAAGLRYTRTGDNYTFECDTHDEAERLRGLLASYADWLKKNSWVGQSKQSGDDHRVTFHAKSVIEFLRQQNF
jgi:hypothetical protein